MNAALTLSAVYRAVDIKAGIIASSPFKVYEKTPEGRVEAVDHNVSYLLSRKPNSKVNKVIYFDRAMRHYELLGNHYALINRNGIGRVTSYELLHPDRVTPIEGRDRIVYEVWINGVKEYFSAEDIIHVPNVGDGLVGKSILTYMREDASLMFDIRQYGESFYGRGGKPAGLLIPKMNANPTQRDEMKQSFREAKMAGGDVILPAGWDYKEISVPPSDAEWIISNNFSIATVGRWFGVPTQKLGDSAVKYNNVEMMGIEFLTDTISPIASKFEMEYTVKSFILSGEKNLYAEMNLDGYLRADSETRAKLYATYIQNGIKKPNEIRKLNNDSADPYGDDLMIQGATVPIRLQQQIQLTKKPAAGGKASLRKKAKDEADSQLNIEGI